ncbi:hypothetical protein C0993_006581 [Termitomyces sp. T159_Od127]|nr:hypothetical protein C0993_006581 [Termitomyces sp. T159_Od127]
MGWKEALTFTRYGKSFQKYRRLFQGYLKSQKIMSYQPMQTQATRILLQSLLSDERRKEDWLRRLGIIHYLTDILFSTSIIMQVAYGHRITSDEDPYINLTKEASYALGNAGPPGNTPIDFFPILQHLPSWFPGTYYAGFARAQNGTIKRLYDYPFDKVKAEMAAGTAKHSFVYDTLESIGHNGLEDANDFLDIKGTAATMYCAGAETVRKM